MGTHTTESWVSAVFEQAVKDKASDIHFELLERSSQVRYRVDGALHCLNVPKNIEHRAVVSHLKVLSGLDVAQARLPQDGRIDYLSGKESVELRVSTLPTCLGENVVIRVLDSRNASLDLSRLGMDASSLETFRSSLNQNSGLILVTGPTGSGKTTTLYAALNEIKSEAIKVITAEDPIEYKIDGVLQVAINEAADLTFERCLRSFLRQDPDVLLVGEIRDSQTAKVAVQASLTGHLVLSTLHTNNAVGAIERMVDLGAESYLLASVLNLVAAQRLVRLVCEECRATRHSYFDGEKILESYGLGCKSCYHSGYKGRTGIYELLEVSDSLRPDLRALLPVSVLQQKATSLGMRSLKEAGFDLVKSGRTTIEEIACWVTEFNCRSSVYS